MLETQIQTIEDIIQMAPRLNREDLEAIRF